MNVIDVINKVIKPEQLLNMYGVTNMKESNNTLRCCCPIHKGNNPSAFVWHLDKNLWYCHTSDCGGGDAVELVQKIEGIGFREAIQKLTELYCIDTTNLELVEKKDRFKKDLEALKKIRKSKTKELREIPINEIELKQIASYRDYERSTLEFFKVSYCERVGDWRNRIAIPIVFDNKLIGLSLRKIEQNGEPKWVHYPDGIKTGEILYNFDNCIGEEIVVICEGMGDVWKFYEIGIPAVCAYGAKLTDEQAKLLIRLGSDLVFAYDGDDAGMKATRKALEKLKDKATMYNIIFEEGKDPGSCTKTELAKYFNGRVRVYG